MTMIRGDNMKKELALLGLGVSASAFGAYALYLGHDGVVIGAVFSFLGTIAGYIIGKKEA